MLQLCTTTIKPPRWTKHWSSPLSSSFPPKLCTDQTTQSCSCSACCLCRKWWGWGGRCVLSLSHTGVQTLLFSLCKGCSFKEPGETACDSHPTTLELPRSVIGEERTAALPDLLRYSDIKDELFHFLSVKPFMHEAHTLFTGAAVRMNVGGPRTQPWGDQLLSEGTHWLSPCWRGKSSSHSVFWW